MGQLDTQVDALYAEAGLADWRARSPRDGEDHLAFADRCPEEWDRVYHDELRRCGEADIADLYRRDRDEFEARLAAGAAYFAPPVAERSRRAASKEDAPVWSDAFGRDLLACGCLVPAHPGPMSLTFRWSRGDGCLGVDVAVKVAQFVGGPRDGETFVRPFSFDVRPLRSVLDEIIGVGWEPFGLVVTPLPTHVWVSGVYRGHELVIRVLHAPDDAEESPDRVPDPSRSRRRS